MYTLPAAKILNVRFTVPAISKHQPKSKPNTNPDPNLSITGNHTPYSNPDTNVNRRNENCPPVSTVQTCHYTM